MGPAVSVEQGKTTNSVDSPRENAVGTGSLDNDSVSAPAEAIAKNEGNES